MNAIKVAQDMGHPLRHAQISPLNVTLLSICRTSLSSCNGIKSTINRERSGIILMMSQCRNQKDIINVHCIVNLLLVFSFCYLFN